LMERREGTMFWLVLKGVKNLGKKVKKGGGLGLKSPSKGREKDPKLDNHIKIAGR